MSILLLAAAVMLWVFLLAVTRRAELHAWWFLIGSVGLFTLLMAVVCPVLTQPLARAISGMVGVVGNITGRFSAYFKYGIIFVASAKGSMTLQVDLECSGIIEIMVYESLLLFFQVYNAHEKLLLGLVGFCYIMLCNALRITVICLMISFLGPDVYYISHAVIGRILFYFLSIVLYFYVFTKPQVMRMKVGNFTYGHHKEAP